MTEMGVMTIVYETLRGPFESAGTLKAFFADECKTETVSGDLKMLFVNFEDLQDTAATDSMTVCRDSKGLAEKMVTCAPRLSLRS
jgi:hypothetical protein